MPLFRGTCSSPPLCLHRKPCATFRPFDSSRAGRGSIEAFKSGTSIHSLALTTAITHWAGRRGGSYIYLTPRAVTFLSPPDSSYRKRCQLMTFRKFHITPNNSAAFYRNSSIGTKDLCGCWQRREREREGEWWGEGERGTDRGDSELVINVTWFPCHHFKLRMV